MKTHFTGLAVASLAGDRLQLPRPRRRRPRAGDAARGGRPQNRDAAAERAASIDRAEDRGACVTAGRRCRAAPRHRRYAHRHWHRYGYYRTAYWEPFPIFWPHFYHNRIHWSRIPWLFRF